MRDFMRNCPETFREQDIIDSQHGPEPCVCSTETFTGFHKCILPATCHPEIRVRHRIVIEISAHKRLYRAVFDMGEHLVHLLWTSSDRILHLGAGLGENCLVRIE